METEAQIICRKLEGFLKPWSSLPIDELRKILPTISISLLEISRRAHMSPERVQDNLPPLLHLKQLDIKIVRHTQTPENPHHPTPRIKRDIRQSVREPQIRGIRRGGKSLDEKTLNRKKKQTATELKLFNFKIIEPEDIEVAHQQRREAIHRKVIDRALRKPIIGDVHENLPQFEPFTLGPVVTRTDIPSTLGPFESAPDCEVTFPPSLTAALGRLLEEHIRINHRSVADNTEGNPRAYQHCRLAPDGIFSEPFFQIDIAGLPQTVLDQSKINSSTDLETFLRGRIFEFESSLAMYGLIEALGGRGQLGILFREHLDLIREKHQKPIVLLAPTQLKFQAMRETEFGITGTHILSPEQVQQISGFDDLWGPDQFWQHLRQNQGKCQVLFYVRPSDPIHKLKDPTQKVTQPLLTHLKFRHIIREHCLTLNIDHPSWPPGDPRCLKDSKSTLAQMGMGFKINGLEDVSTPQFSQFLETHNLTPTSMIRAKPLQGVFGAYGQKVLDISTPSDRQWLANSISLRGPYLLQPEIPPLTVKDQATGQLFDVIDRAFFSTVLKEPTFLGGIRILIPTSSAESRKGRLHGTDDMISAPIM